MFIVPAGTPLLQCKRPRFGEGPPAKLGIANDSEGIGYVVAPGDGPRIASLIRTKWPDTQVAIRGNYLVVSPKEKIKMTPDIQTALTTKVLGIEKEFGAAYTIA